MSTPYRRLTRAAAPAVVVPVLLVALSACGGGSGTDAASPASTGTSTGTPSATTTGAAPTLQGTPVATADFTALVKRSIAKATTARVGLRLVGSTGTITGTGAVDYTGTSPSLAMTLPGFGHADLRVIGSEVYIKVPAAGGRTYFKGNLKDPAVSAQLGSLGGFDPASSLVELASTVSRVTLVGTERLQGDTVRHYQFLADPSSLAGPASPSAASGSTTVTVDAYFDAQDLLRKTQTALPDGTSVTLTLTDWGTPVHITAPPASQVKQLPMGSASATP